MEKIQKFTDFMQNHNEKLTINEKSEAQKKYAEFFMKKLEDYGVKSPNELSEEEQSKFFNEIKKEWK